jgi:regulator of protease activity HflC (stomatin/prohibitin superfamily)
LDVARTAYRQSEEEQMTSTESRNTYLDQVVAQQQRLEHDLRAKRAAPAPAAAPPPPGSPAREAQAPEPGHAAAPGAVDVRVTGVWRWKTVLVPPNAFVVHTRRGRDAPLHIGLGTSFRYNPATDSFLVVPGAMQTIVISAYCICRELQGVLVQAYVQWIIQDFATAYRKLDFSDPDDPMRLVNLQLKEQAEAAVKDKVATMGVHEVLSDKQPIIEELTARLRGVAEGEGGSDTGLGLRIVTVQIKEAVVSSSRLWENLQKPYRAEQQRIARLAELATEEAISGREMAAARISEAQRMENERELGELRARNEAASFDREAAERVRRAEREQDDERTLADLRNETTMHALGLERQRNADETEIGRLRIEREHLLKRLSLDGELALARSQTEATHQRALLELERDRLQAAIDNDQSPASIQAKLVGSLPDIVGRLPKPTELRSVTIGGNGTTTVAGLLAELTAVVAALRSATVREIDAP